VDLSTLPFLPLNDLPRQLVHVELGQSVRLTMVAGDIVFEDGRLTRIDENSLMEEARQAFARQQRALDDAAGQIAPLVSVYRRMYEQAEATEVSMTRTIRGSPS
jgi:5-methylthioadenosine/S-adenosylhomocysteine deaminase